jgi:hypothetical protein
MAGRQEGVAIGQELDLIDPLRVAAEDPISGRRRQAAGGTGRSEPQ